MNKIKFGEKEIEYKNLYMKFDRNEERGNVIKNALIFGDLHMPYHSEHCLNILKDILKEHKFDEVIMAGDIIDASELGKHLNYEEVILPIWKEIEMFKEFTEELKGLAKKSKITLLGCNHFSERLTRLKCENPQFKKITKSLEELGVKFDQEVPYNEVYFPFNQRQIGVIHGNEHSKYFTEKYSRKYNHSLIAFHTHTFQRYSSELKTDFYGIGCMCKLDMQYLRKRPSRWVNGFAVLNYDTQYRKPFVECVEIKDRYAYYHGKVYRG